MRRLLAAVVFVLGGGCFAVARQTGIVAASPVPWDPAVAAVGLLPPGTRVVAAAVLGGIAGIGLFLAVLLAGKGVRLGMRGDSTLLVVAMVGGVVLSMFAGAAVLFAGDSGSMWEGDSGVTGAAGEVHRDGGPPSVKTAVEESGEGASAIIDSLDGDASAPVGPTGGFDECSRPSGPDSDGDRLPDQWEREGVTPDGAPLPGADPDRKDIYLQAVYEKGAQRLTGTERRQLRRVWAELPVANPGDETGVAVHFLSQAPDGGRVDEPIRVRGSFASIRSEYYDERMLGPGVCEYHLLVVGSVVGAAGRAEAPGYIATIDAEREPRYDGPVTLRVKVTTHELLHNVVGDLESGSHHSETGWLATGDNWDDTHLSNATKAELDDGFARPRGYW